MKEKSLDLRYLVLAIVGYSEDQTLPGRTLLQKRAYFINKLLKTDMPFAPYYYGPYSEKLADATDSLVAEGFLKETLESFPSNSGGIFERHKYTYKLTPIGSQLLEIIEKESSIFLDIKKINKTLEEEIGCDSRFINHHQSLLGSGS